MQSSTLSAPGMADEFAGHAICVSPKQKLLRSHSWQVLLLRKKPPTHTQAEMLVRSAWPSVVEFAGHGAGEAVFEPQYVFTGHTEQFPAAPNRPAVHSQLKIVDWPVEE